MKTVFFLVVIAGIGLVGYAYLGPFFGADFSAPVTNVRIPLELSPE